MDYLIEGVIVSVDTLVLAYSLTGYLRGKSSMKRLETVPQLDVGPELVNAVKERGGSIPYTCLRGHVKALSPPIHSYHSPTITGVIHKITVKEHVVSQTKSGFWIDNKKLINEVYSTIPFAISSKKDDLNVEVVDALAAKVMDLEVVSDRFDPATSSVWGLLAQFFTGVRKQGVQTTEELLKEDTLVTVVGEVVGGPRSLAIMPPSDGAPFFISTMPLRALMRRIETDTKFYKWMTIIFGTVTAATFGWILYKRYKKNKEMTVLARRREERRRTVVHEDLPADKICVVCQVNPKEMILLPCGHVCLCEDCSDQIRDKCPLCMQHIQTRNKAYIA